MKTIALAIILCLSQTACVKRVVLTPAQSIRLTSAQSIATISEVNRSATSLTAKLSTQHLISDQLRDSIFNFTGTVANIVKAAVVVQRGTATDQQKAAAVLVLLKKIQLPQDIAGFVSSLGADAQVTGLVTLLKAVIQAVQTVTGGN